ncbi:TetR/AcrR family transcriptional regulator [Glaciibacter flavus]|uniref:TetR/AcrR family transcriptional regulator n=2 Tax=Orlajensenia flava TaxID=2565934 RepID=A0A4S4FWB7_9MICO|nr:TetR/AcrR family transcriptional regulator [Glaciibacter flavus]
MVSRSESAAATRRALVDAAAGLLDAGGPEAVTLRDVGARAGVSRGAAYRHFADKESLLTVVAAEKWEWLASDLHGVRDRGGAPEDHVRTALLSLIRVGRTQPHLYRLMFSTPRGDPDTAVRAASLAQDEFLAIVSELVGSDDARRFGALLLTSAHGIAGMELSGHLSADKWHTTAEELVDTLVAASAGSRRSRG